MKKLFLTFTLCLTNYLYPNGFDDFMNSEATKKSLYKLREYVCEDEYNKMIEKVKSVRITYDNHAEYIENHLNSKVKFENERESIPRILHFIWIGEELYPASSKINLDKWIELHPQFSIILWTDQGYVLEAKYQNLIEQRNIEDFIHLHEDAYPELVKFFNESINPGEKSDILRYMILDKVGGVYVDHDIYPHKAISYLTSAFSFVCCCEPINPTVNKQYFRMSNAFIASRSNHIILKKTIENIKNNWDHSTQMIRNINIYGYKENSPVNNNILVLLRTYIPFTYAVLSTPISDNELVLPAQYFAPNVYNDICDFRTNFITHSSSGAWACKDLDTIDYSAISGINLKLSKKIDKINRKITNLFIFALMLTGLVCFFCCFFVKKK